MGDCSKGMDYAPYESHESRRLRLIDGRLNEIDSRLAVIEELMVFVASDRPDREAAARMVESLSLRAKDRIESTKRMMRALSGSMPAPTTEVVDNV
jgi:hypothetical protein